MENLDLLLKLGTLIVAIVTAYVTAKVTLIFMSKRQEEHHTKLTAHEENINVIKLKLESKVSFEHIEHRYVTKEELKLHLQNIETKQQNISDKIGEVLSILKEKR